MARRGGFKLPKAKTPKLVPSPRSIQRRITNATSPAAVAKRTVRKTVGKKGAGFWTWLLGG